MEYQFERKIIEEQAFRQCQGIQRLAKEYGKEIFIKCCKDLYSTNVTYQDLKKLIESTKITPPIQDKIIRHENIRGAENYEN
jgi:hypothetical protein